MRYPHKPWTYAELKRLQSVIDSLPADASHRDIRRAANLTEGQLKYALNLIKRFSQEDSQSPSVICPACGQERTELGKTGFCIPCELAREIVQLDKSVEYYQALLDVDPYEAAKKAPAKKRLEIAPGASIKEREQAVIKYRKRQIATLRRQVYRLQERIGKINGRQYSKRYGRSN